MIAAQANGGAQGARMDARLDAPPTDGLRRQPGGAGTTPTAAS